MACLAEWLARSFGLDLETVSFTLECVSSDSIDVDNEIDNDDHDDGGDYLEISFLDTTLRSWCCTLSLSLTANSKSFIFRTHIC